MGQLFHDLWLNDIYRAVITFIFAELLLLTGQGCWLALREGHRRRGERRFRRFDAELGESFFDAVMDPDEAAAWVTKASKYKESTIRAYLEPRIRALAGEALAAAIKLYRDLGLVKHDVHMLKSRIWHRRVLAMRRLLFVVGPQERQLLLATEGDHRSVALLAAQGLAHIGSGEDVARVLRNVDVPRRLMEQPVFVLLNSLKPEQFENVLEHYEDFRSDSLKKILVVAAANRGSPKAEELTVAASKSEAMEMRLGAAMAAAQMAGTSSEEMLIGMLLDPVPEVRALAARALGRRKAVAALNPLSAAAGDRSFWVRQNVSAALAAMGDPGRLELEKLAEDGGDAFAADTARQELERMKVLAGRAGGQE